MPKSFWIIVMTSLAWISYLYRLFFISSIMGYSWNIVLILFFAIMAIIIAIFVEGEAR